MQLSTTRAVRFVVEAPDGFVGLERLYARLAAHYGSVPGGVAVEFEFRHRPSTSGAAYEAHLEAQRAHFAAFPGRVSNTLEIHADLLTSELAALCEPGGPFARLDVGIRLYETSDVAEGHALAHRASESLSQLRERRVTFTPKTVLSHLNQARLEEVVQFANGLPSPRFRMTPLFRGSASFAGYSREDELTETELVAILEKAYTLSKAFRAGPRLEPTQDFVDAVARHHDPRTPSRFHDRRGWERSFYVDETGALRAALGEAFLGNVFEHPLEELLGGARHQDVITASDANVITVCGPCRFFGSCDGGPVAEATYGVPTRCPVVRPLLEYVESELGHARTSQLVRSATSDVKVHLPAEDQGRRRTRLFLSAGTESPHLDAPAVAGRHHVAARVPREPFRAPTSDEFRALVASNGARFRRGTDVAVVRIPAPVLAPLRALAEDCGLYDRNPDRETPPSSHPRWAAVRADLDAFLRQIGLSDRATEAAVLYRSSPGRATVTKVDRGQPNLEAYVGLHLDSWEGTSLRQRTSIRNRLGINLSRTKRYFVFMDRTLAEMSRALGLEDEDDLREVTLFAGHKFMTRHPDYPVTRLELEPGEAYIAPTGNLVHDGATPAGDTPDVALHLLGFFHLPTDRPG